MFNSQVLERLTAIAAIAAVWLVSQTPLSSAHAALAWVRDRS